jgi:putative aldouronate transport system permease protein
MYSPLVYSTGDIIDTYVYRMGLENLQFSLSTAVGLVKSIIGFILIALSQFLAKRYAGYSIF